MFESPSRYGTLSYPSNFLQAAPASGDSGGPLIDGETIIGVVQGGDSEYGNRNWWTRVSSFADWISTEAIALGSAPIGTVFGTAAESALSPRNTSIIDTIRTLKQFFFYGSFGGRVWLDPDPSESVEISVTSGPQILSLILPDYLASPVELLLFDEVAGDFVSSGTFIDPGGQFDFAEPVDQFQLIGIDAPGVDLALGFLFSESGPVESDWLSIAAVPIPAAAWLFGSALGVLGWLLRKVS